MKFILLSLVVSHNNHFAQATWSVAGADKSTGQVGGAGASCIDFTSVKDALYNSAPGHGVLLSQALLSNSPKDDPSGPRAVGVQLLMNDTNPADIYNVITQYPNIDSDCDVGYCSSGYGSACEDDLVQYMANPIPWCGCCGGDTRQYGIADLTGRTMGYTGEGVNNQSIAYCGLEAYEGSFTGYIESEGIAYSVQGNTVTESTVTNAYSQFNEGCDLADRLMNALEGGDFENGDGDVRCQETVQSPALGAFLSVQSSNGTYIVDIDVVNDTDAVNTLRRRYDDWRISHPCNNTTKMQGESVSTSGSGFIPTVMWRGSFLAIVLTYLKIW